MKVIELFNSGKQTLSFEFFPPKNPEQESNLFNVITELAKLNPDYVSVTYGALGSNQERSFHWIEKIKKEFGIEPVAHLTCVGDSTDGIRMKITELTDKGVKNILALRGDPPVEDSNFKTLKDGLFYGKELVLFIKREFSSICIGVAGYPEKHPEAKNIEDDIKHLKEKVDAGADYIVTQLFFDNQHYYSFVDKCRKAGIKCPIVPGIMPITSYKQIKKMTSVCGAQMPDELLQKLEKHQDDLAVIKQIGIEQAVGQCRDLKENHVPGLHFFVMNQAETVKSILKEI